MLKSTIRLCGLALGLFTAAAAQAGPVVAQIVHVRPVGDER